MLVKYALSLLLAGVLCLGGYHMGKGIKIASKAWLSQQLIEHAWARTLNGETSVQPWPWADTWPEARLAVPRLEVDQLVLSGDSGRVLAFGPGMNNYHDAGLDMSITMISGHRDTHFRFLKDLRWHDELSLIDSTGHKRRYRVITSEVVNENWTLPVDAMHHRQLLILATCYPFDTMQPGSDQRLLVFAEPLEPEIVSPAMTLAELSTFDAD